VLEPDKADPLRCQGGIGTIGWPGAYGGWWQADPKDRSGLIFLSHNMLELSQMARGIGLGAWSAIGSFHAIATAGALIEKCRTPDMEPLFVDFIVDTLAKCDRFGIPSTSHWMGAAIIVRSSRTKSCIVTTPRTSNRPMPSSLAG